MSEETCRHQREKLLGIPQTGACDLTRRERLLVAVWESWRDGRPMSCTELAARAGYRSVGALHLDYLELEGWLEREPGLDRARKPGPIFAGIDRVSGRPLRLIHG